MATNFIKQFLSNSIKRQETEIKKHAMKQANISFPKAVFDISKRSHNGKFQRSKMNTNYYKSRLANSKLQSSALMHRYGLRATRLRAVPTPQRTRSLRPAHECCLPSTLNWCFMINCVFYNLQFLPSMYELRHQRGMVVRRLLIHEQNDKSFFGLVVSCCSFNNCNIV